MLVILSLEEKGEGDLGGDNREENHIRLESEINQGDILPNQGLPGATEAAS